MLKLMFFIDGTWLYSNQQHLTEAFGQNFVIDYGKLPKVLANAIEQETGVGCDVVRTMLFGSNAIHYQMVDEHLVERRRDFFELLREEFHFEVEVYPIDYRGRRLRRKDRDQYDDFEPTEKCVDIALASQLLYFSAVPNAFDIAVIVAGDKDFIPAIQAVRRLGKRVVIASIKKSCPAEFRDRKDAQKLRDFDLIWLDDILDRLELKIEMRRLECRSPFHKGDKMVYSDAFIRKGRKFYCPSCIEEYNRLKERDVNEFVADGMLEHIEGMPDSGQILTGFIKRLHREKFYGFIQTTAGDFFFHLSDLTSMDFQDLEVGMRVRFEVIIAPDPSSMDKPNGKATRVELETELDSYES